MPAIVSCLTNSYGRFGARGAIELVRSARLECLELPIRTAGVPSPLGDEPLVTTATTPKQLGEVRRLLDRHGIRVTSCNVTSGNPLDPAVVEITRRKLALAGALDVSVVVGSAGEVEDERQLPTLYAHLREIGDCAGELGITYCFETHPGICRHHYGMLETMEALRHPHLKLNFDTGNILYYNTGIEGEIALAKVCPHVRHLHLKDSQGEFGQWYFPALGRGGAVDFRRVLDIMRPLGFHGPYSIEIEGIAGEGELTLEEYHRRVEESAAHLRACGYFDPTDADGP